LQEEGWNSTDRTEASCRGRRGERRGPEFSATSRKGNFHFAVQDLGLTIGHGRNVFRVKGGESLQWVRSMGSGSGSERTTKKPREN